MAAGSLLTRIPVTKGQRLAPPLVEFFYKNDDWRDPLISDRHILLLGLCSATEIAEVIGSVERATDALARHFAECGIDLVDIKYEFGRTRGGRVILIDEITPEVFRAWDSTTGMSLDKDVFRDGSGSATVAYEALLARLETRYG
jgi:phosphoribosylaminoimidazole-succinocarboxamide synthase